MILEKRGEKNFTGVGNVIMLELNQTLDMAIILGNDHASMRPKSESKGFQESGKKKEAKELG